MSDEERDSEGSVEEKPFAVELAKTNRAKCKKCKCPIEKDTVRIAKLTANPFSDGKMKAWHHVTCLFEVFAKQRASTKRIDDPEEDIDGWTTISDEDKQIILDKLEEFEKSAPFKAGKKKSPKNATPSPRKRLKTDKPGKDATASFSVSNKKPSTSKVSTAMDPQPSTSTAVGSSSARRNAESDKSTENSGKDGPSVTKDDLFREFRKLCSNIADASAYTEKTAILKKFLTKGSNGAGFQSDIILWCKLLLPGTVKRIYNLQNKQLVKLFARIFVQDEDEMLEHLEQGDVAETIRVFFENSAAVESATKSLLTIQEVDQFLEKLSQLTKEDEQVQHFRSILDRCTSNDLKMLVRLIKHDLRINAGPKHILEAIHEDAYAAFQASRDLRSVIERCLDIPSSSSGASSSRISSASTSPRTNKVALSLMTPVLPMLAEACKSVEMAMKKCPAGMLAEVKYDGERVQVHKKGSEFRYFSRSLKPVLPHKVNLFKDFIPKAFPDGDDLILDSEVLLIDTTTGQPLPFGSLGVHKRAEFKDANVCLFVFDCIYYNGEVLASRTMKERRQILRDRMKEIPNRIVLSEVQEVHDPQDLAQMIAKVLKMGLEGLVLKDITSKYEPGKRHWLKVKKDYLFGGAMADTADLVVLGAWYGTGNKGGMMSIFLMGCYDEENDRWLTVTKVHTGHDDETLERLQKELDMIKIGKDPNRVPNWLHANKPMIPDFVARDPKNQPVWEITGAEFTNQGVHTADGISIRFPRVTRIRDDKDWRTATNLNELRALFKQSAESMDFSLLLGPNSSEKDGSKPVVGSLDRFIKKTSDTKEVIEKRKRSSDECSEEMERKRKIKIEETLKSIKEDPDFSPKLSSMSTSEIKAEKSSEEYETKVKIKQEFDNHDDLSRRSSHEEKKAEYYSFVDKDYIEYSGTGSPLNWVEGRKPRKGLPADAKPLSSRSNAELNSRCILKNTRVYLTCNIDEARQQDLLRTLKSLGATVLSGCYKSEATHVLHDCTEVTSSTLNLYSGYPKSASHVNVSWVESSARALKAEDVENHAVEVIADYCNCHH